VESPKKSEKSAFLAVGAANTSIQPIDSKSNIGKNNGKKVFLS